MNTFAQRFKYLRDRKGWTQEDVAEKLGLSRSTIAGYESEEKNRIPREETLLKIADLLETTTDYLLGRTDKPTNKSLPETTEKDEKDIAKRIQKFREEIENSDGLAFNGEPLSEEAKESLIESMEYIFRQTQKINKKFVPKKYREEDNE